MFSTSKRRTTAAESRSNDTAKKNVVSSTRKGSAKPSAISALYSRLHVVNNLDKSLRSLYYLSTYSLLLMKTLNARTKRRKSAKKSTASTAKSRFRYLSLVYLGEWRNSLLWLQAVLQQFRIILGESDTDPTSLPPHSITRILPVLTSLTMLVQRIETVLTFSVFSGSLIRYITGASRNNEERVRLRDLAWLGVSSFMTSRFQLLSSYVSEYSEIVNEFFSSTVREYYHEVMEDLQETNPQLHDKIKRRVHQLDQYIASPARLVVRKGAQLYDTYVEQIKKARPAVTEKLLPVVEKIYDKAYAAYCKARGKEPPVKPAPALPPPPPPPSSSSGAKKKSSSSANSPLKPFPTPAKSPVPRPPPRSNTKVTSKPLAPAAKPPPASLSSKVSSSSSSPRSTISQASPTQKAVGTKVTSTNSPIQLKKLQPKKAEEFFDRGSSSSSSSSSLPPRPSSPSKLSSSPLRSSSSLGSSRGSPLSSPPSLLSRNLTPDKKNEAQEDATLFSRLVRLLNDVLDAMEPRMLIPRL